MEKSLGYYMALPCKIELERDPYTNGYTADTPQLKSCITCADDMTKTLNNLEDAKKSMVQYSSEPVDINT